MPKSRTRMGDETLRRNYPLLLKRMERILEVGRTLTSTLDNLPKLLAGIIEAARELSDAEAASIMLFDPITDELRFEAATNMDPTLQGIIIPVEGSIAGWIVTHSEPLMVPDTSQDPRWNKTVDKETTFITRSILGVPLPTHNKTLGALEVLNKRNGVFTDEDASTLQALAAQAAVAIVNARLFQQSDMISEMVHELRTPLMSLSATTHLLLRPDLPADKRTTLIRTMQGETNRLSQMTTDFLDMARLESGRMRFNQEPFDLPELLAECADVIRPQAQERGLTLSLAATEKLSVTSDRGKIKQVVLNLLTNAVKYNREHGQITVALEASAETCRVTVTDTGKGIPQAQHRTVFQPGFTTKKRGWGLGLSLSKRIIEQYHGGRIFVKRSAPGKGTTFRISLKAA